MPVKIIAVIVAVVLLTAGCGPSVSSTDVNPQAMYPTYSVEQETGVSGIKVSAKFEIGGALGTSVELSSDEKVLCNGVVLKKEWFELFGIYYSAKLAQPAAHYIFSYQRPEQTISSLVGTIPHCATIGYLPDLTEGNALTITWNASFPADDLLVYVSSPNGFMMKNVRDSAGRLVISAAELIELFSSLEPGVHTIEVETTRRKFFDVAPFFTKGGTAVALRTDSMTFNYTKTSATMPTGMNLRPLNQKEMISRGMMRP